MISQLVSRLTLIHMVGLIFFSDTILETRGLIYKLLRILIILLVNMIKNFGIHYVIL